MHVNFEPLFLCGQGLERSSSFPSVLLGEVYGQELMVLGIRSEPGESSDLGSALSRIHSNMTSPLGKVPVLLGLGGYFILW